MSINKIECRRMKLVHTGRNTLDATTTSETSDGRLGDALNVVAKNLAVTLGAALSESLTTLATWRYQDALVKG